MLAHGFGSIPATELTSVLTQALTQQGAQLRAAHILDVQHRGKYYYAIIQTHIKNADGELEHQYYGVTTAPVSPAATGYQTTTATTDVFVWRHPDDPQLPGMWLAATPAMVQHHFTNNRELAALSTIIYRPLSRAVFRARLVAEHPGAPPRSMYLKVFKQGQADAVYRKHQLLAQAGVPVVAPIAPPVEDVLALAAGEGVPLGQYVQAEGNYSGFDPNQLISMLDALPAALLDVPHRASWADRYQEFLLAARTVMPAQAQRIDRFGEGLAAAHSNLDLGPLVPTHGDLYEAHILVDPTTGNINHILDIDGAGPGFRVDDYACLVGHLAVLGHRDDTRWGWQSAMRAFATFTTHTPATTLAVRAAAVVLSLIPGYQPDETTAVTARTYLGIAEELLALATD